MDVRRGRTGVGLALIGLMVLGACGGEAESADDSESTRPPPAVEAEPAEDAAPIEEPAPTLAPPAPAAPAPTPTRRPAPPVEQDPTEPVPQERTYPVSFPPPNPVDDRPGERSAPPLVAARGARALEAGHALELRLESGLSTRTSKAGDVFHATVADDVLGNSGEVLIPIGTRFKGRVVESRESPGTDQPAILRLEWESVTVGGSVRPLVATLVDVEAQADARDSAATTAAKVGTGAAAGAIVGRILGRDRESAVKGAVVGAVAGTAAAMATREGHAVIEPGARIVIRLDERLIVED